MTRYFIEPMWHYSIEPRTRKHVKGYGFLSFARKYGKQLLDTASKKVIHKAAEATDEFLGNIIANKIVIQKPVMRIQEMLKK